MSLSQPWIFFVVNETPKLSATTATSTDILLETVGQDVDPDLDQADVETLVQDLQEIDVITETPEEDHQTAEIVETATIVETIVITEVDAMIVNVEETVVVKTLTAKTSGLTGEKEAEAQLKEEEEIVQDVEVPKNVMRREDLHQDLENTVINIHFYFLSMLSINQPILILT